MAVVTRITGNAAFLKAVAEMDTKAAHVGWFSSSVYPQTEHSKGGQPVAYIAAIQEFGYAPKNIPPRMGLRGMVKDKQQAWLSIIRRGVKAILKGDETATGLLTVIGGVAEGDIRKQIASVTSPPLKEATIQRRLARYKDKTVTKSLAKPLVDTGYMLATVTHLVNDDTGESSQGTLQL